MKYLLFLLPLYSFAQDFRLPSGTTREEVTLKPDNTIHSRAIGIMVNLDSLHSLEMAIAKEKCWTKEQWDFYVKAWKNVKCICEKLDVVIDSAGIRRIYSFEEIKNKFICP